MNQRELGEAAILNSENKQEVVYHQIKRAMMEREYTPGMVMVERKLSERYSVSRSPVREALKRFAREGLMDTTPTNRVVIPKITLDEISEVYDVLELIEPYAVRRCADKVGETISAEFDDIYGRMKDAINRRDPTANIWADLDFHSTIIHHAEFKRVRNAFTNLCSQSMRFTIALGADDFQFADICLAQHRMIGDAIVAGDSRSAEQYARAHIYTVKEYHINKLRMQME